MAPHGAVGCNAMRFQLAVAATAVALPDVGMAFYEDIYGHDRRLDEALRARQPPP